MIPLQYSAIPETKPRHITEAVPDMVLVVWSCRINTLMNLAWQYIDTICDLCIQMKMTQTKKLTRAVRELKRNYDRMRHSSLDDECVREETLRAEEFEETFHEDFRRLFFGIEGFVGRLGLTPECNHVVIATYQALTLMDSVRIYARECDREMRLTYGFNAPDESLIPKEFLNLYHLIPQFAGDCYRMGLETRSLTARIIVNRLRSIEVRVWKDGKYHKPDTI